LGKQSEMVMSLIQVTFVIFLVVILREVIKDRSK